MSEKTDKIVICWRDYSRNANRRGTMEIPADVPGKDRIPPLFNPKSLYNPLIHRQGEYVVIKQKTTPGRLPNIGTTFLSSSITKEETANQRRIEPVRTTFKPIEGTQDIQARILLKPIVNRTTITFHDSDTPPYKSIDVTIFRQRQKQSP
jgi:hypothetical protein